MSAPDTSRIEIDCALDAAEEHGYLTGRAREALADLVAYVSELRGTIEALEGEVRHHAERANRAETGPR